MRNILLCFLVLVLCGTGLYTQKACVTTWKTATANESITIYTSPHASGP